MPEKKESYSSILTNAIINWMKKHVHQYIPSYKEIAKDLIDIPNLLPIFSACKKKAFKELQSRGFILEFSPEPKTCNARIIGYKPPDGIGEKVAAKILNIEEEAPPKPKEEGIKWHEDKPKAKLDEDMDEELDSVIVPHKTNSKQKTPFLFYSNKPVCTPRELENLGRMLISMAMIYEGKRLDVKVKIMEGGKES